MSDNSETNVAEILRDIAAASDAISGKIIKKAQKAATEGLGRIKVRISEDDYLSFIPGPNQRLSPPMERLQDLGFGLKAETAYADYGGGHWDRYLIVSW